jgi:arabinofuranan 3-O-arabinosyltransferase
MVDGWMQGYVVPAGAGGRLVLEFTPNRYYQAGLGLGGLLALALLVMALRLRRRDVPGARLLHEPDAAVRGRAWPWPWRLAALLAGAAAGGPAVGAGLVLGDLGRRRLGDVGGVGAVLIGAAGVAAGLVVSQEGGFPPVWCDAVTAAGVGFVAAVVLTRPRRERHDHD